MKIFWTNVLLGVGLATACALLANDRRPKMRKRSLAADLEQRLAKWRAVKMPLDTSGLSARETQTVNKLVDACRHLENAFWRQSDPEGLELYLSLSKSGRDRDLRRFLFINGGRFDLIDENKPFVGTEPMAPGRGLYPKDVTREELEHYVALHPEKKAEIYSPYTVVRRKGDGFVGIPYH